jgi:hypothetical protein
MHTRDDYVEASLGAHTKITATPTRHVTTEAFRKLDLSRRQCRYSNELLKSHTNGTNCSLFKAYSRKSCEFECRLKASLRACNCTPWNYPQYTVGEISEICDGQLAFCFEEHMEKAAADLAACECLPDCEGLVFAIQATKTELNPDEECQARRLSSGANVGKDHFSFLFGEKVL